MSKANLCLCGHEQSDHIYEEGACRPGFVCEVKCEKFESATAKSQNGRILTLRVRVVNTETAKRLWYSHQTDVSVSGVVVEAIAEGDQICKCGPDNE